MPIYKGTLKTGAAYKGSTSLSRIYKGAYLVFEAFKTLIAEGVPPLTLLNCVAEIMLGYKIYGNTKQGELPTGYTQLEYIEADGTQYIDTGITATNNTGMSIKYCYTADGIAAISGIFKSANPRQDTFFISSQTGSLPGQAFIAHRGGTTGLTLGEVSLNTDYTTKINYKNDGKIYYNDNYITDVGTNATYNATIPLFARYSVGSSGYSFSNSRIYYTEFSEGNVITHKFIPAKDINGVIGMYDTIADTFHTNAGTGAFLAGPEMPNTTNPIEVQSVGDNETGLPLGYTELSYIEATGGQYIDTGFSPDGNTKVDYKVETTAGEFDASPFIGARVGSANTARFFPIAYNNVNGECRTAFGSKSGVISNVVAGTVFTGSFDPINGVSTINGTDYDISNVSFQKTENYNLYLFATPGYTDNLYLSHGKIYYCMIYNNGTLVRNFIPCKDTSNVVGMYDTIEKRFYGSETSTPLVAGEEIAKGGYKIPVNVTDTNNVTTTTNIYLSEPLRGFGDYNDYIDFETGKVVRNVEHLVITGQEDWQKVYPTSSLYRFLVSQEQIVLSPLNYDYQKCNYFICAQVSVQGSTEGCSVYNSDTVLDGGAIFRVRKDIFTSLTAVTTFFTTAYNNGNPAYIDFVLATPTEESIELPEILLNKGTNIISVGTSVQPSNMWIKYKEES